MITLILMAQLAQPCTLSCEPPNRVTCVVDEKLAHSCDWKPGISSRMVEPCVPPPGAIATNCNRSLNLDVRRSREQAKPITWGPRH